MAHGAWKSHWKLTKLIGGKLYRIRCLTCKRELLRHKDDATEGSNCICANNAEVIWPFGGEFSLVKVIAGDFNLIEIKVEDVWE